jgi:hypothetical protein
MGKRAGKQLIVLVAAVLAAALVVTGCGSSDSISKAEFVKKADAVCKKGEEAVRKDFGAFAETHENVKKPTEADYAELVDAVVVENVEKEVDDLRALGAPEGDEGKVEAMLQAREERQKGKKQSQGRESQATKTSSARPASWQRRTASRIASTGSPWLGGQAAAILSGRWT